MIFDVFFAICQNEVDGRRPSERTMFENFFDQVRLADELGFHTAWVAETHLSSEIQKRNPHPVIPQFRGEIGLNTDILQLAQRIFSQTKRINVGSAIRNILCNGGPMAHAEAIRTFLTLHALSPERERTLNIGFASGRFPFSNAPYGIKPRNALEAQIWPLLKGAVFKEATEIFLRFLRGDVFSSKSVTPKIFTREQFRTDEEWTKALDLWRAAGGEGSEIVIPPFWVFDDVGVIPFEAPMDALKLTIGAHEPAIQNFANKYLPVGVFNLSITPASVIEETHARMKKAFNSEGGEWTRAHMPRTVLVFIDETPGVSSESRRERARARAQKTMMTYWQAMEGTIDPKRVEQAIDNALVGTREDIDRQMSERFDDDDRLMLWFDLNNHDNESVKQSMRWFMQGRGFA